MFVVVIDSNSAHGGRRASAKLLVIHCNRLHFCLWGCGFSKL